MKNKVNPIEKMSRFLYKKLGNGLHRKNVKEDLGILYVSSAIEEKQTEYYVQKIKYWLIIVLIGNVFAVLLTLNSQSGGVIENGEYIQKKSYGAGNIYTRVIASTKDGKYKQEIELEVEEQKYTKTQLDQLYELARRDVKELVLGENQSLNEIRQNMNFVEKVEGYPFELQWRTNNYYLLDSEGKVYLDSISSSGSAVIVFVKFVYEEWEKEETFDVVLYAPQLSDEEQWELSLRQAVEENAESMKYQDGYLLPKNVGKTEVEWVELKESSGILLGVVSVIVAFAVYILKDKDLQKEVEKRNSQMQMQYAAIVEKMTLYLGAGLSVRSAWQKMVEEYCKKKMKSNKVNYAYEEMLYTARQMQGGLPESLAYEKFGSRCRLHQYVKFSTILSQNLKKGNSKLLSDLRQETILAQEERKQFARKKGEEAGTKLLAPMMLMLLIVMILIMVPAFLSFSGA